MTWAEREKRVQRLTHWDAKGAMAVKEGKKGFTATMRWQQSSPKAYQLSLYGPLGSGHITLIGKKNLVTLMDNKNKITARDGESLIRQQTGHTIPVNSMYYWLRGLPAPEPKAKIKHDTYGHLTSLTQAGWHIQYVRYTSFQGIDLPSKLVMTHQKIKVKIIINSWS